MILQESKTVPIAEADWTDDGEVELLTFPDADGRTRMVPETARALAHQLIQAAADAEKAAGETGVQRAHRTAQHAFDIDQRVEDLDRQVGGTREAVLSHTWGWVGDPFVSETACSVCGVRSTDKTIQPCPGPLEAPGVRS